MAKLLLLDDEPEALELMTAALATDDNEVRAFRSGRDALAQLREWRPDVIIADIFMPELDGFAFARLARTLGAPPIMFISIALNRAEAVLSGAVGYVQKPATAAEIREAVAEVLGHARERATILVVDDDDEAREIYVGYLRPVFEVVEAANGVEALERLHDTLIDLVITDFHMPEMNGLELIRAMRADERLERTPVIVQTSDRIALSSPAWRELEVAYMLDKLQFFRWLRRSVDALLPQTEHGEQHAP
jgi:CheY-like chemotaxis protein